MPTKKTAVLEFCPECGVKKRLFNAKDREHARLCRSCLQKGWTKKKSAPNSPKKEPVRNMTSKSNTDTTTDTEVNFEMPSDAIGEAEISYNEVTVILRGATANQVMNIIRGLGIG